MPQRVSLRLPRELRALRDVRQQVSAFAEACGFDEGSIAQIEMAVDEALSNAIRHGSGEESIGLDVWEEPGGLCVALSDRGRPFSFEALGNDEVDAYLERDSAGGLGLVIIKQFMDDVSYTAAEGGSRLEMRKRRRGAPGDGDA